MVAMVSRGRGKPGKRKLAQDSEPEVVLEEVEAPVSKKKKRKLAEPEEEPAAPARKNKKKREQKGETEDQNSKEASGFDEFPDISNATRKTLQDRGIKTLFEIQRKAFGPAFQGCDVVGRAKTGEGKTLAFVLPCVERIRANQLTAKSGQRRLPVAVAVAPTRELARQISKDFESIGSAAGLQARCFYGGTAFGPQCDELRAGVDLLVCTPGRLLDHVRRETIDLSCCRTLVLDEADEMLSMGFQDDVDAIMEALPKDNVQKLLFSATLPKWVNKLVEKHLKEPTWIDVTTEQDPSAANANITHKCVSCPPSMRGDCIGDLCKVHAGHFGKTLVFTDTKKECDELAANEKLANIGAGVLHGDIGQNQREAVMEGFRSGRIRCLVATDVAARGLDVPSVALVVQTHPPQDLDMYVHRSGRTGRAGHKGTSVTFYSFREEYLIRLLEHKKKIKMQRIGPPQPADVVNAATLDAVKRLDHVHQDSIDAFMARAQELIADRGAEVALAASLAALSGHARRLRGRSLLSAFEGCTAIMLESERTIETPSKGWYLLRQMLPEDLAQAARGLTCCKGGLSVIFDAPEDLVPRFTNAQLWRGCKITVATALPELQERDCDIGAASQQLKDRKQQRWQFLQEKKANERTEQSARSRGGGGRGSGLGGGGKGRGRGGSFEEGMYSRDDGHGVGGRGGGACRGGKGGKGKGRGGGGGGW